MKEIVGNLLDTDCSVIAHGVNAQGVMSAGVARVLVQRYPGLRDRYLKEFIDGTLKPGSFFTYLTPDKRLIANLVTQRSFGRVGAFATKEWITRSADAFLKNLKTTKKPVIAIPRIGCGYGGLDWDEIRTAFLLLEENHNVEFKVYRYLPK